MTNGWVKIRGDIATLQAIRESKVPTDGMFISSSIWVPRWVREAIELYNKNMGYAELTLTDFLRRMDPTQKT